MRRRAYSEHQADCDRRTGLTLPQQKLDEHGLEEVSQLFSSPKKPSPLKQMYTAEDLAGDGTEDSTAMTGMDSTLYTATERIVMLSATSTPPVVAG